VKKFFITEMDVSKNGPAISMDQQQRKLFSYSILPVFLIGT
jgi:hypothetical protein